MSQSGSYHETARCRTLSAGFELLEPRVTECARLRFGLVFHRPGRGKSLYQPEAQASAFPFSQPRVTERPRWRFGLVFHRPAREIVIPARRASECIPRSRLEPR